MRQFMILTMAMMFLAVSADAQIARVRQAQTGATSLEVAVGEVIEVEIVVDPHGTAMAGAAVFLTIEGGAFDVLDLGLVGESGTQPFLSGPLFNSRPIANRLLSETEDLVAQQISGLQLDYAVYVSDLADASTESGVLATMTLLAIKPAEQVVIKIDDNPIRETRLIGDDLVSEMRFLTRGGMEIKVVDVATAVTPRTWGVLKLRAQ
ncbi:MAG: hypothetical protein HN712_28895 [Gemmatimonadetes bacterium]|jgi:hypothetical protein|nr:hypothetical protein [Gemmatimonadota bacterium]MBT6145105.1 hypothetical protein [Gemmatimonadota bacterium]MBT7864363.1 hypothetical protein [Gemmatimonadota bacterium]